MTNEKLFKITEYEKAVLKFVETIGHMRLCMYRNAGEVWVSNFPNHGDSFKVSDILNHCEVIDHVD